MLNFFFLWQQMDFNSSAMFTHGVQSSSLQLLKWKQKRAWIPVRCTLLDAFPSHWQGSLTVHSKSWQARAWMSSGQRTALSPLPVIQNPAFAISEGNKIRDIQGWEIQTPTHWENVSRTGYWAWKLAVWSHWWWVLSVALLFLFCFCCLPFGYC